MSTIKPVQATLEDFEQKEEIAWGSLATIVHVVYKKNKKHYALKILNKAQLVKKKVVKSAMVEKDALIRLGTQETFHPGIVRLHHCFHDSAHLYFILDLASNGDLKAVVQKLGSLSLPCARYYTAQLVDAILFLHQSGVVHRDIKPENVLLDSDMRIKLADFGCAYTSSDLDTPRTNTFVGTAAYLSPEVLGRTVANPKSADIWAVGCTLFFFFHGSSPFIAATDYLTMKRVRALDYSIPSTWDLDASNLIRKLLVSNPDDRLGVTPHSSPEALRQHPFFVGHKPGEVLPEERQSNDWSVIQWDRLWVDPAPRLEAGNTRPKPSETPAASNIWSDFENLHLSSE